MPYLALLRKIWSQEFFHKETNTLGWLEQVVFTFATIARIPSPSNLKHLFSPGSAARKVFMDMYVVAWVLVAILSMLFLPSLPKWASWVFAFEIWDICSYRVYFFLVKSQVEPWRANLRRTLLIAFMNCIEIILGFSIIYFQYGDIAQNNCQHKLSTSVDALYFSVVTIMTVGYGDFAPCSEIGRVLVIGEISTSFVFVIVTAPLLLSAFSADLRGSSQSKQKGG